MKYFKCVKCVSKLVYKQGYGVAYMQITQVTRCQKRPRDYSLIKHCLYRSIDSNRKKPPEIYTSILSDVQMAVLPLATCGELKQ